MPSHEVQMDGCVPGLIAAQAARTPEGLALTQGAASLTYRELDQRATALAHRLRALGVGADVVVGLHVPRSLASVVGALGILRAGGAYLPLDPDHPPERVAYLWKDAQARFLVAGSATVHGLDVDPEHVIALDREGRPAADGALGADEPAIQLEPHHLAYVIYTSGSTGEPKGVELTHGGLGNLVHWHQRAFHIGSKDRASHLVSLSFDAAVWEVWPYLACGASVHLADNLAMNDPGAVRDWMLAQGITIGFLPTPLAELVMTLKWPRPCALRMLLTGADTLHHYPPPRLPFPLVNNYGPTECTVVATSGTILPEEHPQRPPTIGQPIDNTCIRILDDQMQPVPAGTIGEIHIGGAGLARGYRNRPALTLERFVPDPFATELGARLYKTGDLARLLPGGQIAFEGRADEQIKIRGFRIEPAEIERMLGHHPAVQAGVVVARPLPAGDKQLAAYLVLAPGPRPAAAEMRNFLAAHLPPYMIPAMFVSVPALPLTSSGKVDRAALPRPASENTLQDGAFATPQNPQQERVGAMVADLLGVDRVGVDDNFFLLGGDSMLGTRLISALSEEFDVELSLLRIFESPTVAALASEIERLRQARLSTAVAQGSATP